MKIPLDEFLLKLREFSPEVKISQQFQTHIVQVTLQKETLGWIHISLLNNKGYVDVEGVTVMDDINASRNLEVTAATYRISITRTNKAKEEAESTDLLLT